MTMSKISKANSMLRRFYIRIKGGGVKALEVKKTISLCTNEDSTDVLVATYIEKTDPTYLYPCGLCKSTDGHSFIATDYDVLFFPCTDEEYISKYNRRDDPLIYYIYDTWDSDTALVQLQNNELYIGPGMEAMNTNIITVEYEGKIYYSIQTSM